jgi:hypothetical protein
MKHRWMFAPLMLCLALPVFAQRGFRSGGRVGGSVFAGNHGARVGGSISMGNRPRVAIGGGVSFGHRPRYGVIVNSRPIHRGYARYSQAYVYPYSSYAYPAYPYYPLAAYDSYSYVAVAPQMYPSYVYAQEPGLAEQMRQQQVGVYAQPQQPAIAAAQPAAPVAAPPERELPLTVLVYRDGHRSEVRSYGIVGQTLWIFSEERAEKIPLAQLDLDATRKVNDERGIEFMQKP